jgi:hypothetical protein
MGLSIVGPSEVDAAADEARREGVPLFVLSTGDGADREAFFDAVRRTLPLDPPLPSARSWDALEDSVWQGIYDVASGRAVIVWRDAPEFAAKDRVDFEEALSVFKSIAQTLSEPRYTDGRPKTLCVYVANADAQQITT